MGRLDQLWSKLFQKPCFGDPRKYCWVTEGCKSCTSEERLECREASFKSILSGQERFRLKHGHDRRYTTTQYWESKGVKGWGKYHEKYTKKNP